MKLLSLTRDTLLLSVHAVAAAAIFEEVVLVPFFRQKGLAFTSVSVIMSVFAAAAFAFEFITGVIADRFGHRRTLILAAVALVLGNTVFLVAGSLVGLCGGAVLVALAIAARSGADSALMHEVVTRASSPEVFNRYISKLRSLIQLVQGVVFVCGGLLFAVSPMAPLVGTMVCTVIAGVAVFCVTESRSTAPSDSVGGTIIASMRQVRDEARLRSQLALAVVVFPTYHVLHVLAQPWMGHIGIPAAGFGIFYAVLNLGMSVGAHRAANIDERLGPAAALALGIILVCTAFVLGALLPAWAGPIVPFLAGLGFGLYYVTDEINIHRAAKSEVRASILSLQHALTKPPQVLVLLGLGVALDAASPRAVAGLTGVFLAIGAMPALTWVARTRRA